MIAILINDKVSVILDPSRNELRQQMFISPHLAITEVKQTYV